jgi:hypothetical protein
MLTSGKSVKGKVKEGLISNAYTRKVMLSVTEP